MIKQVCIILKWVCLRYAIFILAKETENLVFCIVLDTIQNLTVCHIRYYIFLILIIIIFFYPVILCDLNYNIKI
jgi:hypothetical protein